MLLVQEGRFRLLRDDGRGLTLALSPSAPIEPQDLPPLLHRRVGVEWEPAPGLVSGKAHRVERL
ncbi:hypothetical protein [Sabulicella rubraurantiaca]|uniref:hypothetical protein n=1 Tax=Sabulicella rubraurantiaca TaxID=2811429 RepID=UPI001A972C2D|nr:hypothetical protein [Sabulicella rubraurantiaca]